MDGGKKVKSETETVVSVKRGFSCSFLTSVCVLSVFWGRNSNESVEQEGGRRLQERGLTQGLSCQVERSTLISINCHLTAAPNCV